MLIKAVIFDFDGVIAETEHIHRQAWCVLSDQVQMPLPEGFLDLGIGSTNDKLARFLWSAWNEEVPLEAIVNIKCEAFSQLVSEAEEVLVPGVLEAFSQLRQQNIPMAIATSSPHREIDAILSRFQIQDYFSSILTLDDVTEPKPHPEVYLRSAAALGYHPSECLVFEDSILGSTSAREAGAVVIGVTTSFSHEELQPVHHSIPHFEEIAGLLAGFQLEGCIEP